MNGFVTDGELWELILNILLSFDIIWIFTFSNISSIPVLFLYFTFILPINIATIFTYVNRKKKNKDIYSNNQNLKP